MRSGQPAASTGASPASPRVYLNTKLLVRLLLPVDWAAIKKGC